MADDISFLEDEVPPQQSPLPVTPIPSDLSELPSPANSKLLGAVKHTRQRIWDLFQSGKEERSYSDSQLNTPARDNWVSSEVESPPGDEVFASGSTVFKPFVTFAEQELTNSPRTRSKGEPIYTKGECDAAVLQQRTPKPVKPGEPWYRNLGQHRTRPQGQLKSIQPKRFQQFGEAFDFLLSGPMFDENGIIDLPHGCINPVALLHDQLFLHRVYGDSYVCPHGHRFAKWSRWNCGTMCATSRVNIMHIGQNGIAPMLLA
jgi:hypothetical protein